MLLKLKDYITTTVVKKELKTGSTSEYKVLSDNNLTDALVTKINKSGTSNFSGNYNDLTNKPSIPSKVSQLTNDTKYITAADIPTKVSAFTNDSNYQTDTQVTATVTAATKDLASKTYVDGRFDTLMGEGVPETLDTLKEIADAITTSDSDVAALTQVVSKKLNTDDLVELTTAEVEALWDGVFAS